MYKDDSDLGPSICRSSGRLADITPWRGSRNANVSFQMKRKKKKKEKRQSSPGNLSPCDCRFPQYCENEEKGVFFRMMMRERFLSVWRGRWFRKKEKQWSPVGCVQGRVLWICCCVCISQLLAGSFCASAAMFFFYVSFWLAELAADWLIAQGGYYMAAIAMRSSPIIPFRRDHREPPVSPPPTISPLFLLPSLSSCPPTHMQSWVNRAPPALRTDGCRKRQEPCFLLLFAPLSLSLSHPLTHASVFSFLDFTLFVLVFPNSIL